MPLELPAPDSILVINVSRIGDTLLATPALRALAAAWPAARIAALGHPKRYQVLEHLPFVAQVGPISKHRARVRGWLPSRRWDLALVYGFDRPLVAYALRVAQRVVAFRQDDPALDARLYRAVARPPFHAEHAARTPLRLTAALGVPEAGLRLGYAVTPQERAWARVTLAGRVPAGARPLIGLQVASFPTKGYRDWPLEHFAALCARILARWPQAHFLILGGALERARTATLEQRLAGHASAFAGKLSLRRSAALMNALDLYIGVDTGPTHIMGALDAPMVALYHCYSPARLYSPLERPRCYVVDHPRAEQGCDPETPMAEIPVERVYARVAEALAA